ncbi:Trypsin-like serine protease, typically periplasmic, containing C-terminal PDZ domain [Pyrobaculum sp. WP30]|nr:Trypsin-like serine protease, typically periplasmic, containing C-terminal PDZ domain [Pyrobaculum sp. WP30]
MDLSNLVEKVSKSVVAVTTRRFEWPGDVGLGTAFAVDRGVYVTAYHVVASGGGVALVTPEGEWSKAEVAAADPAEDLALLYSDLSTPPLPMGSVLRLRVGQGVVAVGFPLALLDKPTATFGIVSAVGRSLRAGDHFFEYLIQTDAAINPGNSGGPLVDMSGTAVGVCSAVIAGAQGVGFAVPIDLARVMYEMVRRYGRYVRPALGIYVVALNKALKTLYRLPTDRGLLVVDVVPGSPAEEMGLARGDVVTRVNGREVNNVFEFRLHLGESIIQNRPPRLEVLRGGEKVEL